MMTKNAPKKCSHRATYSIPKFRKTSRPLTHKYTLLAKPFNFGNLFNKLSFSLFSKRLASSCVRGIKNSKYALELKTLLD